MSTATASCGKCEFLASTRTTNHVFAFRLENATREMEEKIFTALVVAQRYVESFGWNAEVTIPANIFADEEFDIIRRTYEAMSLCRRDRLDENRTHTPETRLGVAVRYLTDEADA